MTVLYNKTTTAKKYGTSEKTVVLPPAPNRGERGEGVEATRLVNSVLSSEWQRVLSDFKAGLIEIITE